MIPKPLGACIASLALAVCTGCLEPAEAPGSMLPDGGFDGDGRVDATPVDAMRPAPDAMVCRPEIVEIGSSSVVERTSCGAAIRFAVTSAPGARVSVQVRVIDGPLRVTMWWPDVNIPVDRAALADGESTFDWVQPARAVELEVGASAGTTWRVQVSIAATDAQPIRVDGELRSVFRPVTRGGLGEPTAFDTVGARVDLVDPDGRLVAVGGVADDGRFDLEGFLPDETPATVRLVAETATSVGAVLVGPDARLPWAEPVAEVIGSSTIDADLDPEGATAAAWFITRTAADGMSRIARWLPDREGTPVVFQWRPGFSPGCGSCFRPGPEPLIELGGRLSDPDQWDTSVILHELGHHIAAVYSRDDSGGGPHDGGRIDPAIAWSEGWATFHASWQTVDPIQLDYKITGVATLDVEEMADPRAFETEDGSAIGAVSERLVAAVLWDLWDGGDGDDDPAEVETERLFAPLFEAFRGAWIDRGAPGIDLVDYLDALWCAPPVGGGEVLESRGFAHAPACRAKASPAVEAVVISDRVRISAHRAGWLGLRDETGLRRRWVMPGETVSWRPRSEAGFVGIELDGVGGKAVVPLRWRGAPPPAPTFTRRGGAWELSRDVSGSGRMSGAD